VVDLCFCRSILFKLSGRFDGEKDVPFTINGSLPGIWIRNCPCPPNPDIAGSVTASANEVAIAASTALPPNSRIFLPAMTDSGEPAEITPEVVAVLSEQKVKLNAVIKAIAKKT